MMKLVSTSKEGFWGWLSLDQVPEEKHGTDVFLLLAKEAFSRVDVHLDLNMTMIRLVD